MDIPTRILFIGNSYTQRNQLPLMLQNLVHSVGVHIECHSYASGGQTLVGHAQDKNLISIIKEQHWHIVVLQEQSIIPALESERLGMYQAVRYLDWYIKQQNAKTLLFLTWGREHGLVDFGFEDYQSMQEHLEIGYRTIGNEVGAFIVPVGQAWRQVVESGIAINLWAPDGSHPSLAGSYLAACVFHSALLGISPEQSTYSGGLTESESKVLQKIAWQVHTIIK